MAVPPLGSIGWGAVDFEEAVLDGSVRVYSEMLIWIIARRGVC